MPTRRTRVGEVVDVRAFERVRVAEDRVPDRARVLPISPSVGVLASATMHGMELRMDIAGGLSIVCLLDNANGHKYLLLEQSCLSTEHECD